MPRSVFIIPAVAGAIMFVWAIGMAIGWALDVYECAWVGQVPAEVMAWNLVWVALAVLAASIGAGILAFRLDGRLALTGTLLTVVAIVLGAEIGWAIAMGITGCERADEGPALTLLLFTLPSAIFGFAIGWALRRAGV